jgi:Protein of unknown function (DUF2934)
MPSHDEISECAYQIWEQEGRPLGRALDHWVEAELQLVLSSIWRNQDLRKGRTSRRALPGRARRFPSLEIRREGRISQASIALTADDS